ncbi:PIN domain-like protein, partial [Athelia psychrophila]
NTGQNAVLQAFFWRLTHLLSLPVAVLFVFDGPDRPGIKRGKQVKGTPHWMENGAKSFIEAFGFQHITALGEAEAELAVLNSVGMIDVVVTDDSDALVFGAVNIMRKRDKGNVSLYRAKEIQSKVHSTMTHDGLILYALLAGGDYDNVCYGVENCGKATALAAVKYGLGASLHTASLAPDIQISLAAWRERLREVLASDPDGIAGSRRPAAAANISNTFPSPEVLNAYTAP